MVICPLCNADLDYDEEELDEGDEFTCDECGGAVRVASSDPIELEGVADDKEGDDEFEDDDEDDEDEEEYEEEDEENEEEEW
jgi:uncharacterized protein YbaR (Trm112 family)